MTELLSLHGLGFGDCGKGLFTDFFSRQSMSARRRTAVVRFNGGAQAGHNVVLPDGRHHTFSQFGAGTLVPGVWSVMASPVVLHPGALLVEHAALKKLGVSDALQRSLIDARCRINTPFHQAAGRLRELQREGDTSGRHGSCGVGVGETVRDALAHPDAVLRYGDLAQPTLALDRSDTVRLRLLAVFDAITGPITASHAWQQEITLLRSMTASRRWLDGLAPLLHACPPQTSTAISARLQACDTVVFEGAQGLLLDEWHGFHPHTTWSSTGPDAVRAVADDLQLPGRVQHFGILRSYLTRHGQGPMPTHDSALDMLAEPHNASDGWQGSFRRGHADAVLLRYALAAAGSLNGLLVSHLDLFDRSLPASGLQWCEVYEAEVGDGDAALCERDAQGRIVRLLSGRVHDLDHQTRLTALLNRARPVYADAPVTSAADLIARIESIAAVSVTHGAYGPTHTTVVSPPLSARQ